MSLRPRHFVFILSLLMLFTGTIISWETNTNFGTTQIVNVFFSTAEGIGIFGRLYVPPGASSINPLPGVLVIHGFSSSKEGMMAFNIELARHGFVVLAIDVAGHGYSDPGAGLLSDRGGRAGLEYLANLPYVNALGIVGHSMGAWITIEILNSTTIPVQASVLVGGGVDLPDGIIGANATHPFNLLIAIGRFDELFYPADLTTILSPVFGTAIPIIMGQTYGNVTEGSARRLISPPTNHLFEVIDPIIVTETVQWFTTCLKTETEPSPFFQKFLLYPMYLLSEALVTLGLILTIFPLLQILIRQAPFRLLRQTPISRYEANQRRYLKLGFLYGVIGLGTFLPFMLLGVILQFIFLFPQAFAPAIACWLLGSTLIATFILRILRRRDVQFLPTWEDFGGFGEDRKTFLQIFGRSALLALLIIIWIYLWVLPLQFFWNINFQLLFPFFKPLTPHRTLYLPLYFLFAILFFLIEGLWLIGVLRVKAKTTWIQTQTNWTVHAIIIKTLPLILVVGLQFLVAFATGFLLFPGFIGFMLLFLWGLIPLFLITPVILAWSYRISNRIYIGALINALILCWSLAATFPIL